MIVTAPDNLAECDDQRLREIERKADAMRIRAIVELETRARSGASSAYAERMAKRPQWAQTAAKLLPGSKGRIIAAAIVMLIVMFRSMVGPLHDLYDRFEAEREAASGQQGR